MKSIDIEKIRTERRLFYNYEKLKFYRKQYGYTQEDISVYLGVPYQQYQKWESGKNIPSVNILMQLAQLYEIKIENFFN